MISQEQHIIFTALKMFNKLGIKSVTMDDLANELGISKKTLYKYFDNKADLVHKSGMVLFNKVRDSLMLVHQQSENAIDELFDIDRVVSQIMENHNPGMRFQLQKYYSKTYDYIFEGRRELINKVIHENTEMGKRDGLYRADANTDITTYLYCSKVETMPEEEEALLSEHSIRHISRQALIYHIRGLATDKGAAYLEEKLKTNPIHEN